jgi:site-specific DNA-cytosine methylase
MCQVLIAVQVSDISSEANTYLSKWLTHVAAQTPSALDEGTGEPLNPAVAAGFARLFANKDENNSVDDDDCSIIVINDINYPRPQAWRPPPQHRDPIGCGNPHTNPIYIRNPPIGEEGYLEILPSYTYDGMILKEGDTVELSNGDFVRIKHVLHNIGFNGYPLYQIRGHRFRRSKELPVPRRFTNEVVMCVEYYRDDRRSFYQQSLFDTGIQDIVAKRTLIITSDEFPLHSYRDSRQTSSQSSTESSLPRGDKTTIRETGHLVCRYVFTRVFKHTYRGENQTVIEGVLRRVQPDESDIFENSCQEDCICRDEIDMEELANGQITYGSGFCGGGGDICGAKQAGAKLVFAFDNNSTAIETCRMNNPGSESSILNISQYDLLMGNIPISQSHIHHSSFPCQAYSPANTRGENGRDWAANSVLMTSVSQHLKKFRPLVHTQENTSGLVQRYTDFFFHDILEIAACGYNVRWKLVNLQELGLSASRRRVLIIAARHDIPLPEFPAQKFRKQHSEPRNLPLYRTIYDSLKDFDDRTPVYEAMKLWNKHATPYDPKKAYANCITTGGTDILHPSGMRSFIYPELARLQTFPDNYVWAGTVTEIKKQIGNAVPPLVWKEVIAVIMSTLRDHAKEMLKEQHKKPIGRGELIHSSLTTTLEGTKSSAEFPSPLSIPSTHEVVDLTLKEPEDVVITKTKRVVSRMETLLAKRRRVVVDLTIPR